MEGRKQKGKKENCDMRVTLRRLGLRRSQAHCVYATIGNLDGFGVWYQSARSISLFLSLKKEIFYWHGREMDDHPSMHPSQSQDCSS